MKAIKFKAHTLPGDIIDDRGVIRVVAPPVLDFRHPSNDEFWGVEFGEVLVTEKQAEAAVAFGWQAYPDDPNIRPLVRIHREAT
jgi:hypothetical protein